MKNVLRGGVVLVLLVVIGFGLYAARLVGSLETPEFKARVEREASAVMGVKVQFASLDVSLLRGIRLGGIHALNPPGFAGDLFSAEGARLSYDLWPLLLGRVQVDELSLRRPTITLESDARGNFNYQKLSVLKPAPPRGSSPAAASSALLKLVVSKLSVEEARFAILDEKKMAAFRLEGASLDSAIAMESGVLTGTGTAGVDSAVLANALYLRRLRAPLKLTKERLTLVPLQARLAEGAVSGEIQIGFKPDLRYSLRLAAKGASVATLIKEAGSTGTMTGTLDARAKMEGTGGLVTMKGAGQAEIKDCRWPRASLFNVLAEVLQIPELRDPRFDECRVEFALGGGQARTPLVSFKGPAIELTGQGVTNLVTSVIDYDLTLALSPGLLLKVPAAMRAGFKTRPDGFASIPFKVTGTTHAPHADLVSRVGEAMAIEAVKEGLLGRLFGPKKKP
ncbi:MAG TPA: AsmA-like C-terminal region-containing protein [Vicinamibacteria bacterium]|nr:AsmA-like C-terminal region-containing protein [Vicinamibacteria bacterium]